jgi:hypothetical protein
VIDANRALAFGLPARLSAALRRDDSRRCYKRILDEVLARLATPEYA